MRAKDYLEQVEVLNIKIRQMEQRLECMRETAGGAAAIRYDKDNVQHSIQLDTVEKNVIRLIEMEDKIFAEKVRLEAVKNDIMEQIQMLDDKRYIDILYMRYVERCKFEEIAVRMRYDPVYVRELHGEALGYFETRYANFLHNLTKE